MVRIPSSSLLQTISAMNELRQAESMPQGVAFASLKICPDRIDYRSSFALILVEQQGIGGRYMTVTVRLLQAASVFACNSRSICKVLNVRRSVRTSLRQTDLFGSLPLGLEVREDFGYPAQSKA